MKRISFSYPLPQAIREGRKKQTRRANGLEVINVNPNDWQFEWADYSLKKPWRFTQKSSLNEQTLSDQSFNQEAISCPYGKPGDVLAVLEEHYMFGHWEPDNTRKRKTGRQPWKFVHDAPEILYRENPPPTYRKGRYSADPSTPAWHKRLARFMPSHAVRTYIELTDIKAERLQEISEEDAKAEGVIRDGHGSCYVYTNYLTRQLSLNSAKSSFKSLWQSIHGEESWNANPWVWVIEFKLTEKP